MSPTSYSRALSSLARLLTLLKNISKVPSGKWLKRADSLSCCSSGSFRQDSTITAEVIRKIPTRTGMIDPRVVPFGYSAFNELDLVQQ